MKTEIGNISLDLDSAIPCGLIINELVSNTLKYAFPQNKIAEKGDGFIGEIFIGFQPSGDGIYTLIVGDNGVGLPKDLDFTKTESLGLQLVTGLVEQLKGSIVLENGEGTTFKITFSSGS